MEALKLNQHIPEVEVEEEKSHNYKGSRIFTSISEDEKYLYWIDLNNADQGERPMLVTTWHKGLESGKYVAYDDDSFDNTEQFDPLTAKRKEL